MRLWWHGEELLIERGDGGFVLIDAEGRHVASHTSLRWSDEDSLGGVRYAIDGSTLVLVSEPSGERTAVLQGLVPASDEVAIARARAFDAAERAEEAAIEEAGRARLAGIPGAFADHGLGDAFAEAQRRLGAWVSRYGDPRFEGLLRVLLEMADLYVSAPGLEDALGQLVWACRKLASDEGLSGTTCDVTRWQELHWVALLPAHLRPRAAAVVARLRALEELLAAGADDLESIDARLSAIGERAALAAVVRARELVEAELAR